MSIFILFRRFFCIKFTFYSFFKCHNLLLTKKERRDLELFIDPLDWDDDMDDFEADEDDVNS